MMNGAWCWRRRELAKFVAATGRDSWASPRCVLAGTGSAAPAIEVDRVRSPSSIELIEQRRIGRSSRNGALAWQSFCKAVLASNEFIY